MILIREVIQIYEVEDNRPYDEWFETFLPLKEIEIMRCEAGNNGNINIVP